MHMAAGLPVVSSHTACTHCKTMVGASGHSAYCRQSRLVEPRRAS